MTSGEFSSFPVDQITVDREARQRRELKGIEKLAASIQQIGLINALVINESGQLIAGERRLKAVTRLGWTNVPVQFAEDLPEDQLHLIELEENIRREDLEWQDECRAIAEYHRLKSADDSEWTQQDTADALGMTQAEVSQKLGVVEEMDAGNEDVLSADKYSVARGIVRRSKERKGGVVLEQVRDFFDEVEEPPELEVPILNEDFVEWAEAYKGPRFNFLHCDFPYGIDADAHNQGAAKAMGGYEDSAEVYEDLVAALADSMDHIVADQAHLMFWFPMDKYQWSLDALEAMGWTVNPYPLIWHKSDNTGILPDPSRGPRRIYETAFMASRGDRKVVKAVGNTFPAPVTKDIHMSEKSRDMLRHFFRMFVDDSTTILDPTCGSGNAVVVAEEMGAERVLGLELNPEFCQRARDGYVTRKGQVAA